ncbi:MAG: hypothetical protein RLZZ561_1402 [Pseudomonadota bacterium]
MSAFYRKTLKLGDKPGDLGTQSFVSSHLDKLRLNLEGSLFCCHLLLSAHLGFENNIDEDC